MERDRDAVVTMDDWRREERLRAAVAPLRAVEMAVMVKLDGVSINYQVQQVVWRSGANRRKTKKSIRYRSRIETNSNLCKRCSRIQFNYGIGGITAKRYVIKWREG